MSQWFTITLRCWVAFIAFTNFGAAFRCFTEDNFVRSKFFAIESPLWKSSDGAIIERMYGLWSLMNCVVLSCCFFFIEDRKIIGLSMFVLVIYISFFAMESYFYKTLLIHGPTIYPCALSALTLLWLLASLKVSHKPSREEFDENEVLRRQFQFKSINRKVQ